jgi:hypothetical protein
LSATPAQDFAVLAQGAASETYLVRYRIFADLSSSLDTKLGRRKTVNMNEDIAHELNRLANLQGKTLYSLINEIGMRALEAHRQGFSLDGAVAATKLLQSAKRSRKILVNQDLWYFASSQAMKTSKNRWLKLVRDTAQWESNVFLTKGVPGQDVGQFIESVRRLVGDFFWDCGDFSLEAREEQAENLVLKLAFVPEMPLEHTQALFKAFEAMFNVQGFLATDSAIGPGFLSISFKHVAQVPSRA